MTTEFLVESPFRPSGDQPRAIARLAEGVTDGLRYQTLEGITGSGKTALLMFLLAGASGVAALTIAELALRRLTDPRQRLRLDRLK